MRTVLQVLLLVCTSSLWAADQAGALDAIRAYKAGQSRAPLAAVRALVGAAATDAAREELAKAFTALLASDASSDAKQFVCGQLSLVGTKNDVPALAALLADKELGQAARAALERIPGEEASAALRKALGGAQGAELAGLISSLGERRDAQSVAVLTPYLEDSQIDTVEAALDALGKIGTAQAAAALQAAGARLRPRFMPLRAEALLKCAEKARADKAAALAIYVELAAADKPQNVRTAALLALLGIKAPASAAALDAATARDDPAVYAALLRALAFAATEGERASLHKAVVDFLGRTKNALLKNEAALLLFRLHAPPNLALGATATSPDDLEKDGDASGDQAAIDGDLGTYWDEVDGKDLYRLCVTFPQPTEVSVVKITGFVHQNYAPKDFEILCDGKQVAQVTGATYSSNELLVQFAATRATTLELKITGYYGKSPAIRELGVYNFTAAAK